MKTIIVMVTTIVIGVLIILSASISYKIGYNNGREDLVEIITKPAIVPNAPTPQIKQEITDDEFQAYFFKQFIDNADSANITMEYNNTGDKGYSRATLTIGIDKKWDNSH